MAGDETQTTRPGTPDAQLVAGLAPGSTVDRYRVIGPLGVGGMGRVYEAYDPDLDRRVAIKLLRVRLPAAQAQSRIMHEAKAMARLSHPCVITVYDVGTLGERVFIAMERVDGVTLGEWLRQRRRSFEEIVHVFIQAAEGLSAAHEAGLVHRDFKPSNVLVQAGPRARVGDFGVAGISERGRQRADTDKDVLTAEAGDDPEELDGPPTEPDGIVGTPRYMAPEVEHGVNDARSDQYSFCVALYEALFETAPTRFGIPGPDREREAAVPGWLDEIVRRGLSRAPEERYPSMAALLADLAVDAGARRELASVWGSAQKEQVRNAFLSTDHPRADEEWAQVCERLDAYTDEWMALHVDAYRRARSGASAGQVEELRMLLLGQRLRELQALVELLATADRSVVERAVEAVVRLSSLGDVRESSTISTHARPPANLDQRERVEQVGARVAEARALRNTGRSRAALLLAREATAEAIATGYQPALADAELLCAQLESETGDAKGAWNTLHRSLCAAEAGHDDLTKARAAIMLVYIAGYRLARTEQAERWASFASAIIDRMGGYPPLECQLTRYQGMLHALRGDYDEANDMYQRALALAVKVHGENSIEAGLGHTYWAVALAGQANFSEALRHHHRELAIAEYNYGSEHPTLGMPLNNLGCTQIALGDLDGAQVSLDRCLDIWTRVYGPDYPLLYHPFHALARTHMDRGAFAEAEPIAARAVRFAERAHSSSHPAMAPVLATWGDALTALGRADAAVPHCERAVALWAEVYSEDHGRMCSFLASLGEAQLAAGDAESANESLRRANRVAETTDYSNPVDRGRARFALARAMHAVGDAPDACRSMAERARADFDQCAPAGNRLREAVVAWLDTPTWLRRQ